MQIYAIKNGQNFGPYTQTEIMARIKSGEYTGDDLGWLEGGSNAAPLSHIMAQAKSEPKSTSEEIPTDANLMLIAWKQKAIIWIAVAWVVCGFMPMWETIAGVITFALYAVHVLGIIVCWQLAQALRKNVWLWAFLAFVPLVNLVAYAILVSQATKTLKEHGIPTGIMGADRNAIERIKAQKN